MTRAKVNTKLPTRPPAAARRAGVASRRENRTFTAPGAQSEFWQRLRAARMYAELTQDAIAVQIKPGISRSAYAYWEAEDATKRSEPSAQQIVQVARICKVPIDWLLDDMQRVDGLYKYMQDRQREVTVDLVDPRVEARGRAFWSAVEHMVIDRNVKLAGCFNVDVKGGAMQLTAGFLCGKTLCGFANVAKDWRHTVAREGAHLLAIERLLGRAHEKVLVMYIPDESMDVKHAAEYGRPLGIKVHAATTPAHAAQVILKL